MWAEEADGLIIPCFHSEGCWLSGTSQPGHGSTKLLTQRRHQTSCTGGPFVLCFRSLFLACWPEWWKFGCWELGEETANKAATSCEPTPKPNWLKRKSCKRPWATFGFLCSYTATLLLFQNTTILPTLPSCFSGSCSENTHWCTQLRPTRTLAEPRGASQTATIMRTSLICLSEWGAFSTGE